MTETMLSVRLKEHATALFSSRVMGQHFSECECSILSYSTRKLNDNLKWSLHINNFK